MIPLSTLAHIIEPLPVQQSAAEFHEYWHIPKHCECSLAMHSAMPVIAWVIVYVAPVLSSPYVLVITALWSFLNVAVIPWSIGCSKEAAVGLMKAACILSFSS
jgi:hypothetical protein